MGRTVLLKRSSLVGSYPNLRVKLKEFKPILSAKGGILPLPEGRVACVLLVACGLWLISCGDPAATSSPTSVSRGTLKEEKRDQQHSQSRGVTEIPPVVLPPARDLPLHSHGFHSRFSTALRVNVCTNVSYPAAG